jgi:peptidoglycan/LPS O-acetylase OafA/YrhL
MSSKDGDELQPNNFDLIRLFAAAQVMIVHFFHDILGVGTGPLVSVLYLFHGVPIFFFTSGFLVSASWERRPDIRIFAINRFLRIYPALVAAFLFSLLGIMLFYHPDLLHKWAAFGAWVVAQLTLGQDWSPHFLHNYGMGHPNASLWTIPVEISFYICVPLLYRLFAMTRRADLILLAIIVMSTTLANVLEPYSGKGIVRLLTLSPVTTIGMFCLGMLVQRHRNRAIPFARRWALLLIPGHVFVMVLGHFHMLPPLLNSDSRFMGLINLAMLAGAVMAAAFCARSLAEKLLRRQDISYGLYLFHLPVANMLLANGFTGMPCMLAAIVLSILAALLSWFFIEAPALRLKPARTYEHSAITA